MKKNTVTVRLSRSDAKKASDWIVGDAKHDAHQGGAGMTDEEIVREGTKFACDEAPNLATHYKMRLKLWVVLNEGLKFAKPKAA